jgi:hypothetical protein
MAHGAFAQLGAPPTDIELTPFVEPDLCTVSLTARSTPAVAEP